MLTWARLIVLTALIVMSMLKPLTGLISLSLAAALLAAATRIQLRVLLGKNILIAAFTAFFSILAVVSGLISGPVPYREIAANAARIVLIFNCAFLGAQWIGHDGLNRILASIPSLRARMFFILFGRVFLSLTRSHRSILDHLRTRLDMGASDRLLVARYYLQNIMEKEMYAYRFHQAAIITRITGEPTLVWDNEAASAKDIITVIIMGAVCAATPFI